MYGENWKSEFRTSRGSIYTVIPNDVIRHKYDGTDHRGNGKNIFFVKDRDADLIAGDNQEAVGGRVYWADGEYVLQYQAPRQDNSIRVRTFHKLHKSPAVGETPIDVVLDQYGNFVQDHRFHVGDVITNINYGG
jgi:hypothetical protein